MSPSVDPLGEENHLIFTSGPANGTNLPFSSKSVLNTKSPLTNVFLFSVSSGTFSHQMRKTGYWAIDIKGIADTPTYIEIDDQGLNFKDATSLWGIESSESQRMMRGGLAKSKAATIAIGPAGEKLIKYASILADGPLYRAFGRGGAGSVMGSKKLKGVVISSNEKVCSGNEEEFQRVKEAIIEKVKANKKWVMSRHNYGSSADTLSLNELGIIPTRNWMGGQFEGIEGISPATTTEKWPRKTRSCGPFCLAPCSPYYHIEKGPYQGAHCDGPEYEAYYAFGSNCGIDKTDAIVAAEQICDENGLDVMSAGVSIGFAMECFEKGLIDTRDTDGIELRFGDDRAMIKMLKKIVNQEGVGKLLGEGTRKMSEEIRGSEAFAMHVKGLELGGYECRGLMGQALQFAINNRGGCHHGYGLPARLETSDGTRMTTKGKGEQVKNLAIRRIISDSVPVCTFAAIIFDNIILARVIASLFGESWSVDDLKEVGLRIMCQERLFNMREGITRKDDSLPARLLNEPKPDGPTKGAVVPLEELKDDYYQAMGWDLLTGNPTDALLEKLKIKK